MEFSDAIIHLCKIDNLMKEEANHLHKVIDVLHLKHKEYADGIQTCIYNNSVDQSEIKRLAGFWIVLSAILLKVLFLIHDV